RLHGHDFEQLLLVHDRRQEYTKYCQQRHCREQNVVANTARQKNTVIAKEVDDHPVGKVQKLPGCAVLGMGFRPDLGHVRLLVDGGWKRSHRMTKLTE